MRKIYLGLFKFGNIMVLLLGFLGGFFSSMPIGPINLIVVDLYLSQTTRFIYSFIAGVLLADITIVMALLLGFSLEIIPSDFQRLLSGVSIALILIYAFASFVKDVPPIYQASSFSNSLVAFISGYSLCVFNPLFYLFWVSYIANADLNSPENGLKYLLFPLGVFLGDIVWFLTLGHFSKRVLKHRSLYFILNLKRGISLGLLSFAMFLIYLGAIK